MAKKKLRPLGDIMLDFEKLREEMIEGHDLQWGDVLGLVFSDLTVHAPQAKEEYTKATGGGHPVFYYGPKEGLK